jgi:hypothetical protein
MSVVAGWEQPLTIATTETLARRMVFIGFLSNSHRRTEDCINLGFGKTESLPDSSD